MRFLAQREAKILRWRQKAWKRPFRHCQRAAGQGTKRHKNGETKLLHVNLSAASAKSTMWFLPTQVPVIQECPSSGAFAPTIHRTYREVRTWFRELEPEDIPQQVLTFSLELVASATVENLIALLPIALARSLRKNSFRWAEKEKRALLKRQPNMQADTKNEEPAVQDQLETVFALNDFLGYCCQIGVLSRFERELLIRFKVDGFSAKEIQDRHTALSERAVLIRVHRVMQRLQDVEWH
jgi:DNA-directed RNA polymerase specialized sigma24 family protein